MKGPWPWGGPRRSIVGASVPRRPVLDFRLAVLLTLTYCRLREGQDSAVILRCAEEAQQRWGGRAGDALICATSCAKAGMELPEDLRP